jgi:hypothetical protein
MFATLSTSLENLRDFPEMPFQGESPPFAYHHISGQKEHAEKFIELVADFVRALEQQGDLEELRRGAAPFARLAGPGSQYQEARDKAFKRLSSAFEQASPGGIAESLSVPELSAIYKHDRFADSFVNWADVQKYLGDADSLLRFPSETCKYCAWLTEFLHYQELIELTYALIEPRERIEEHTCEATSCWSPRTTSSIQSPRMQGGTGTWWRQL